jgi:hypothetical protein
MLIRQNPPTTQATNNGRLSSRGTQVAPSTDEKAEALAQGETIAGQHTATTKEDPGRYDFGTFVVEVGTKLHEALVLWAGDMNTQDNGATVDLTKFLPIVLRFLGVNPTIQLVAGLGNIFYGSIMNAFTGAEEMDVRDFVAGFDVGIDQVTTRKKEVDDSYAQFKKGLGKTTITKEVVDARLDELRNGFIELKQSFYKDLTVSWVESQGLNWIQNFLGTDNEAGYVDLKIYYVVPKPLISNEYRWSIDTCRLAHVDLPGGTARTVKNSFEKKPDNNAKGTDSQKGPAQKQYSSIFDLPFNIHLDIYQGGSVDISVFNKYDPQAELRGMRENGTWTFSEGDKRIFEDWKASADFKNLTVDKLTK